jgi:hypothetical protein
MKRSPIPMKLLLTPLVALGGLAFFSSCETNHYEDSNRSRGGPTTVTTTEETTLTRPYNRGPVSTTVETQTTRGY